MRPRRRAERLVRAEAAAAAGYVVRRAVLGRPPRARGLLTVLLYALLRRRGGR